MTNEEAIRSLMNHFRVHDDGRPTPVLDEAENMAYKALNAQLHAHWINLGRIFEGDEHQYGCSNCKEVFQLMDGTPKDNGYKYCPNCGARMDEAEK